MQAVGSGGQQVSLRHSLIDCAYSKLISLTILCGHVGTLFASASVQLIVKGTTLPSGELTMLSTSAASRDQPRSLFVPGSVTNRSM